MAPFYESTTMFQRKTIGALTSCGTKAFMHVFIISFKHEVTVLRFIYVRGESKSDVTPDAIEYLH